MRLLPPSILTDEVDGAESRLPGTTHRELGRGTREEKGERRRWGFREVRLEEET